MELTVQPVATDLFYQVSFEEPIVDILKHEALANTMVEIAKVFGLRLNDVKLNSNTPSDNFLHFFKFDGTSSFEVSFGFEEVTARLMRPLSEEQVTSLHGKLFHFFETYPIISQQMNIGQQLSTDGDVKAYLKSLNPVVPTNLAKYLDGRGVYYIFKLPEHELRIHVTLVSSLFIPGGIYLGIENNFRPNKYDFTHAFQVAKEYQNLLLTELNLKKVLEMSNGTS